MKEHLNQLIEKTTDKNFKLEMTEFHSLFKRYILEKELRQELDWDKINSPHQDQVIPYRLLSQPANNKGIFTKLAVLKLNGGLGTTMVIYLI